jgi:hypothetical protein
MNSNPYRSQLLYVKKLMLEGTNIIVYLIVFVYTYYNESHYKTISEENFYYSGYIIVGLNFLCLISYTIIDIYLNVISIQKNKISKITPLNKKIN